MTSALTATVAPTSEDEVADQPALTLHVVNSSHATVEMLNPDVGRPSPDMNWRFSIATYRASVLMSYGYLTLSVIDETGEEVEKEPVESWATPVLRQRLTLPPGHSFDVVIPLGQFFRLTPGGRYRVSVVYGDHAMKVRSEGTLEVPATRRIGTESPPEP